MEEEGRDPLDVFMDELESGNQCEQQETFEFEVLVVNFNDLVRPLFSVLLVKQPS